jgi:histidinol-phosphatase
MSQNPYLSIAIEAARAGEEVIRHYYTSNLKISVKQDRTPVTVADIETEEKIREVILGACPEHGFYGEETGKTNADAEYIWLIDPIDGTKSFIREYPFFSTQIALMHRDEIILGVSNGVMFEECAWASRGQGAFLNGQPTQSRHRVGTRGQQPGNACRCEPVSAGDRLIILSQRRRILKCDPLVFDKPL